MIVSSNEKRGEALPCLAEVIELQGEEKIVTVSLEKAEMKVRVSQARPVTTAEAAWLEFSPESIHLFDKDTGDSLAEPE